MRSFRLGGASFGIDLTPVVRNLIITNFAVWVVQLIFGFARSPWFDDWFALDPDRVLRRPWQLLTYMFMHSAPSHGGGFNPLHILLNMLMLLMFGGAVERALGSRRFLRYYLICGLAGGLLTLVPPFRATTVGASGAVLGVLTAFGVLFPDVPVLLFFFPVPARIMVIFLALLNLFSAMGTRSGVSFIAHIGGMAAGFLMLRGGRWTSRWSRAWQRRSDARLRRSRAALGERRDAILDKMSREGRESLSREEWRTLLEESKRMREGRDS